MKKLFYLLVLNVLSIDSFAQVQSIELTPYLFPEFVKGVVLMKSGVKNEAFLNYNSLTEEMIFDNKGTKLALGQLDLIDTVYVDQREFFLINKKFVEVIYKSKYALYAAHKSSLKDPGKPAAYGGSSQTSATTSYSSYFSGGQVYQLKLPEGYETKPFVEYWLEKDGKRSQFISIRQLVKLFRDKEELVKEYVKTQDVKYDDPASLVELIRYLELN